MFLEVVLSSSVYPGFRVWCIGKECLEAIDSFLYFSLCFFLLPHGCKSKMWKPEIIMLLLATGLLPHWWFIAQLNAWWWWVLCPEKEMFGFHDRAAFYKNIGDPQNELHADHFPLLSVLSLAEPFKYPLSSSPPAPLVPFSHLWLPDDNRVKKDGQPHAWLAELIPMF